MFVSSTLSATEKNYAQIEREPLATISAIKQFHKYLYSREFVLVTDYQPLQTIFNSDFKPYFSKRYEISVENGCLAWGNRVIIPSALRQAVLELLHENHLGVLRSKMLARTTFSWPNIRMDIEKYIAKCDTCQMFSDYSQDRNLVSWLNSGSFFHRIHIDFLRKDNYNILIIFDTFSKWIDLHLMSSMNANAVISKLKNTFAFWGFSEYLVSDNGPSFNSQKCIQFCQANGISPMKSLPYHPQYNGSAERAFQIVKHSFLKSIFEENQFRTVSSMQDKLSHFLFANKTTPSTVTDCSPVEMIFKVRPRTRLDLLKPNFVQPRLNTQKKDKKLSGRPMSACNALDEKRYTKNVKKDEFSPYKIAIVQEINDQNMINILEFCRLIHNNYQGTENTIFMSDEAHFYLNGDANKQNCRYWAQKNGQTVTVAAARYVQMLQAFFLPQIQNEIRYYWFQQDGATSHTGRISMDTLRRPFPKRVISRNGTIP
ncbi:hypothetical protein ILUMI_04412 [Ignelater luminosus]|uniref:RNA-directed DNA polymerase n=1 Tax=Ignelater luminosus TaxID=2038154 RepID=A0A8K0DCM8_IGNLU|nr:hypothetical protein ILUMI_04412 [Ignelater luminosus]